MAAIDSQQTQICNDTNVTKKSLSNSNSVKKETRQNIPPKRLEVLHEKANENSSTLIALLEYAGITIVKRHGKLQGEKGYSGLKVKELHGWGVTDFSGNSGLPIELKKFYPCNALAYRIFDSKHSCKGMERILGVAEMLAKFGNFNLSDYVENVTIGNKYKYDFTKSKSTKRSNQERKPFVPNADREIKISFVPEFQKWTTFNGKAVLAFLASEMVANPSELKSHLEKYEVKPTRKIKYPNGRLAKIDGQDVQATNGKILYKYKAGNNEKFVLRPIVKGQSEKVSRYIQSVGNYVFGFDQLPEKCKVIGISAGEKDTLALNFHFNKYGYYFICLSSETSDLDSGFLKELQKRCDRVFVCYDNDKTGIEQSKKLAEKHNIERTPIERYSNFKDDICDLLKGHGVDYVWSMFNGKHEAILKLSEGCELRDGQFTHHIKKDNNVKFSAGGFDENVIPTYRYIGDNENENPLTRKTSSKALIENITRYKKTTLNASPGMGKTTFSVKIALSDFAKNNGFKHTIIAVPTHTILSQFWQKITGGGFAKTDDIANKLRQDYTRTIKKIERVRYDQIHNKAIESPKNKQQDIFNTEKQNVHNTKPLTQAISFDDYIDQRINEVSKLDTAYKLSKALEAWDVMPFEIREIIKYRFLSFLVVDGNTSQSDLQNIDKYNLILTTHNSCYKLRYIIHQSLFFLDEGHEAINGFYKDLENPNIPVCRNLHELSENAGKTVRMSATPNLHYAKRMGYKVVTSKNTEKQKIVFHRYWYNSKSTLDLMEGVNKKANLKNGTNIIRKNNVDILNSYKHSINTKYPNQVNTIFSSKDPKYKEQNDYYQSIVKTEKLPENVQGANMFVTSLLDTGVSLKFKIDSVNLIDIEHTDSAMQCPTRARLLPDGTNKTIQVNCYHPLKTDFTPSQVKKQSELQKFFETYDVEQEIEDMIRFAKKCCKKRNLFTGNQESNKLYFRDNIYCYYDDYNKIYKVNYAAIFYEAHQTEKAYYNANPTALYNKLIRENPQVTIKPFEYLKLDIDKVAREEKKSTKKVKKAEKRCAIALVSSKETIVKTNNIEMKGTGINIASTIVSHTTENQNLKDKINESIKTGTGLSLATNEAIRTHIDEIKEIIGIENLKALETQVSRFERLTELGIDKDTIPLLLQEHDTPIKFKWLDNAIVVQSEIQKQPNKKSIVVGEAENIEGATKITAAMCKKFKNAAKRTFKESELINFVKETLNKKRVTANYAISRIYDLYDINCINKRAYALSAKKGSIEVLEALAKSPDNSVSRCDVEKAKVIMDEIPSSWSSDPIYEFDIIEVVNKILGTKYTDVKDAIKELKQIYKVKSYTEKTYQIGHSHRYKKATHLIAIAIRQNKNFSGSKI
ncbi:MAG: toprim domain-containing protein [Chitinophagales bacterium]